MLAGEEPQLVIGIGGYAAGPLAVAAWILSDSFDKTGGTDETI